MTRRSAATARGGPSAIFSPNDSTTMRCESDMTARVLCSMSSTDTPPALMAPISRTMASISVGLSPAMTSSSNSRVGSVASARASSSSLRAASVSPAAGARVRAPHPAALHDGPGRIEALPHGGMAGESRDPDVLDDGELRERPDDLEGARQPEPADLVGLETVEAAAAEAN